MERTLTVTSTIEKTAVFSNDKKKRYELTMKLQSKKEKSILVLCLNPASDNLQIVDMTTNYLMNNLFEKGYTTITICNLYATICQKLSISGIDDNSDNLDYIHDVTGRDFHTILIGYGNTFANNKRVEEEKQKIDEIFKAHEKKVVELVDDDEIYSRLKNIHPLFAGQRFSGKWKFRKHIFELKKAEGGEK